MATKGVIIWRGDFGNPENNYSKSQISDVTDVAALDTLATVIGGHSDCNIAKKNFTSITLGTDAEPGADANVDRKAICTFRDATTLKIVTMTFPGPKSTSVEDRDEGERVTDAAMIALEAGLEAATGKTLSSLSGKVIQKG
ncbi:MAG: hypothetical protein WBM69_20995 [Desulfobacterales bacterium]